MHLRKHNSFELWGSIYPVDMVCEYEPCHCAYHVVDLKLKKVSGFATFIAANKIFQEISGASEVSNSGFSIEKFTG